MVFLPLRVTVRRSWAIWVAPANSTQAGAVVTLMVRVVLRPCPWLVVVWDVFPGQVLARSEEFGLVGFDGEDVVPAGGGDLFGGVGLGVHGIDGDDDVGEVEEFQESLYCWDLITFRGDRELPDHCAGALVESGDQVRCCRGLGPCTTHGLAVQGDHATRCDSVGAGPHKRADVLVEEVGIEAGEHPSDGRFVRARRCGDPEDPEGLDRLVGDPFTDRDERLRAAEDGCQSYRED